jgi:hypothetical protein
MLQVKRPRVTTQKSGTVEKHADDEDPLIKCAEMTDAHYFAYYELHEIPWEIPAPIRFKDDEAGTIFELGHGPYHIPRMASPTVSVRAGGARIETVNENYVLEGGTYFGMAIPARLIQEEGSPLIDPSFEKLHQGSDDAAKAVGLVLDQRIPLGKVAEYVRKNFKDDKPGGMIVRWQMRSGAAASISQQSVESIRIALNNTLRTKASSQVILALRWYDQSKTSNIGPDRLIALWIALEALMAPVKSHADLVKKTTAHLACKDYALGLSAEQIKIALGLDRMLEYRNQIMHRGSWPVPWPVVPGDQQQRDWPQILCDVVGEMLRVSTGAALTGALARHVSQGHRQNGGLFTPIP